VTIAIAGANGFVGRALARRLAGAGHRVIGLTRGPVAERAPGIEWRRCDLFSLLQCEESLAGAEQAVYLVHSMLPSAHLTQGAFQDMDLIIADNFARAAAKAGLRQTVYLGGLIPEGPALSRHLQSRLEVERTLGSRGTPLTALRAGIVIGAGGSSFQMMLKLVRRLPLIFCPPWARTPSHPIALADLLELLVFCLERPSPASRQFDIGCPEILSYRQMLERIARLLGFERLFVDVPLRGTFWCRRWLRLVTGAPKELVVPLLESMRHPMVAKDRRLQEQAGLPGLSFDEAVRKALQEPPAPPGRRAAPQHNVRSVQRIPLPPGRSARWAAERYGEWLPRLFKSLLRAERDAGGRVRLMLAFPRLCLIEHEFSTDRSQSPDRQVYYITGGLLARKDRRLTRRPRIEFREALNGSCLLVAIHDYRPTLPWFLYNLTQAPLHLWVMRGFARQLQGLK